jgi:uncharacterized protein (DUF58 family)
MKKITLLSLISLGLIVAGLTIRSPIVVGMAFPFILYMMSGLFTHPRDIHLDFERTLSSQRAQPGNPIEVRISVFNNGDGLGTVLIEDYLSSKLTVMDGSPRHLLNLGKGDRVTWKYTIKGKRGYYKFDFIHVETHDRLGIITTHQTCETSGELLILPAMLNLKRLSIRPRKTRVFSGEIPARSGGLGVEFYGVREFQTGDSPNRINWRASARHISTLFTNEFEQERVADVGLILDGRKHSNPIFTGNSIFEHSVLATATLANTFIHHGNRTSLLYYGKFLDWITPGYGKFQREKILRTLTDVEPGHSMVFSYLEHIPTKIFPPQSQIVLISPLTKDDTDVLLLIRARGYSVLVISPNPVIFEKNTLENTPEVQLATRVLSIEREIQIRKLIQGGIQVVDWDVAQPFDQVVGSLSQIPRIIKSI